MMRMISEDDMETDPETVVHNYENIELRVRSL